MVNWENTNSIITFSKNLIEQLYKLILVDISYKSKSL